MIQFLEDLQGKGTAPISAEEREELEKLRDEQAKLRAKIHNKGKEQQKNAKSDSEDSDDSSEVIIILFVLTCVF